MSLETGEQYKPRHFTVDLSKARDTESEADLFIEALKKAGIYNQNLLFCGFDGTQKFRIVGTFFATWEEDLKVGDSALEGINPLGYAFDSIKPAIAVIDSRKVRQAPARGGGSKHARVINRDPTALTAIVYLTRKK